MYPYRVHIVDDPVMENILEGLRKNRTMTIRTDKDVLKALGHKLKPIRRDAIFIGTDRRFYDSNISLKNPFVKIEKEFRRKGKDFIFKM